ncbi:hypothetical protein RhiirC2_791315 [Rhizophagus irregularis]|uniref:Uncharacterized protein n=1 Tax=Rhizophagus irregularis TaxID=588596 RepID=A0A2N1MJG4_9GLOM|nr:hypothetical protein RhiirC2_791315 [Rhizophagus irregularis]
MKLTLLLDYDFNEYAEINFSNNNLECLWYWPSDIEIDNAISIGYEKAIHLAKYLEMTARFPDLQLNNFWNDDLNPRIIDKEEINSDDLQVTFLMEKNYNCQVIVELVEKLPDISWSSNDPKFNYNYILDSELNVDFFLDLRQSYDTYMSRNLKQIKTVFRNNENNTLDKLDVNIANHLRADNSAFLPLQIRSFMIAKFDNTFCVVQFKLLPYINKSP